MNPEDGLHREIVNQIIITTPEWWKYARLELRYKHEGDTDSCQHIISNPQFPKDYVEATAELHLATRNLVLHYKKKGYVWRTAVYEISEGDNGEWKFKVDFTY